MRKMIGTRLLCPGQRYANLTLKRRLMCLKSTAQEANQDVGVERNVEGRPAHLTLVGHVGDRELPS